MIDSNVINQGKILIQQGQNKENCPLIKLCYLFAILLNDNMDLHMLSLGTLVSEGQ